MESPFYGYYYVSTDCLSNKWSTKDIEDFLKHYGGFLQDGGHFKGKSYFCDIQLLNVRNYQLWSSNDYNKNVTNYIDITTMKKLTPQIEKFFHDFECFLGWRICIED